MHVGSLDHPENSIRATPPCIWEIARTGRTYIWLRSVQSGPHRQECQSALLTWSFMVAFFKMTAISERIWVGPVSAGTCPGFRGRSQNYYVVLLKALLVCKMRPSHPTLHHTIQTSAPRLGSFAITRCCKSTCGMV
jgi:hypothetical protein